MKLFTSACVCVCVFSMWLWCLYASVWELCGTAAVCVRQREKGCVCLPNDKIMEDNPNCLVLISAGLWTPAQNVCHTSSKNWGVYQTHMLQESNHFPNALPKSKPLIYFTAKPPCQVWNRCWIIVISELFLFIYFWTQIVVLWWGQVVELIFLNTVCTVNPDSLIQTRTVLIITISTSLLEKPTKSKTVFFTKLSPPCSSPHVLYIFPMENQQC